MHNPTLHNFVPAGPGMYVFSDMHVPPRLYSVTREQVKSFVTYDALLCSGEDRANQPVPLGYDEFAYAFNFNEPDVLVKFTTIEGDNVVKVNGPAVTTPFLVGDDEEVPLDVVAQPAPIKEGLSRDPDGGRWLNQRKAALVEDTLWDNLARSHRQNLKRDEAIQARKDRRKGPYSPFSSPSPVPTNHHPRLPTPRGSAPHAGSSNQTTTPLTQDDVRMNDVGEADPFAAPGPLTKKGKGRKE
ncbi:hypothetical protein EDD22DRAFT_848295 [Suillus occidentalis]|nr:hypothetical protein EDD22DRAFT_848295 [Suillus occidentalis]